MTTFDRLNAVRRHYGLPVSNYHIGSSLIEELDLLDGVARMSTWIGERGYLQPINVVNYVGNRLRRHENKIAVSKQRRYDEYNFWLGDFGQQSL